MKKSKIKYPWIKYRRIHMRSGGFEAISQRQNTVGMWSSVEPHGAWLVYDRPSRALEREWWERGRGRSAHHFWQITQNMCFGRELSSYTFVLREWNVQYWLCQKSNKKFSEQAERKRQFGAHTCWNAVTSSKFTIHPWVGKIAWSWLSGDISCCKNACTSKSNILMSIPQSMDF